MPADTRFVEAKDVEAAVELARRGVLDAVERVDRRATNEDGALSGRPLVDREDKDRVFKSGVKDGPIEVSITVKVKAR